MGILLSKKANINLQLKTTNISVDGRRSMASQERQIRWSEMTKEERKEVVRVRNARSAKEAREDRRSSEKRMDAIHGSNEERLHRLEETVSALTTFAMDGSGKEKEGRSSNGPTNAASRNSKVATQKSRNGKDPAEGKTKDKKERDKKASNGTHTEARPSWFGDAFWNYR